MNTELIARLEAKEVKWHRINPKLLHSPCGTWAVQETHSYIRSFQLIRLKGPKTRAETYKTEKAAIEAAERKRP